MIDKNQDFFLQISTIQNCKLIFIHKIKDASNIGHQIHMDLPENNSRADVKTFNIQVITWRTEIKDLFGDFKLLK